MIFLQSLENSCSSITSKSNLWDIRDNYNFKLHSFYVKHLVGKRVQWSKSNASFRMQNEFEVDYRQGFRLFLRIAFVNTLSKLCVIIYFLIFFNQMQIFKSC